MSSQAVTGSHFEKNDNSMSLAFSVFPLHLQFSTIYINIFLIFVASEVDVLLRNLWMKS